MRTKLLIICTLTVLIEGLAIGIAVAQKMWMGERQNDYLFTDQIITKMYANEAKNFALGSYQLSFIGEYFKSLAYMDSTSRGVATITSKDSVYFSNLQQVDAVEYIDKKAASEKVIMINEAHQNPRHRVFTLSLLEKLYKRGFRYLGLETLSFEDTLLNQRKYPIISTGFYSVEPQYGELIREAIKLGFTLFPYEATDVATFTNGKAREIAQARKIEQILRISKGKGIIIHAGFDHTREDSIGGNWGKAMAGRFKEFTGIDPLTINQVIMTECSAPQFENPYFRLVNVDKPSVFTDSLGIAFAGSIGAVRREDIRVIHPRTKLVNGRPDWLFRNGVKKPFYFDLDESKLTYPYQIKAFMQNEDEKSAVPVDVIEVIEKFDKALVLKPGKYKIIVKDKEYEYKKEIIVK